MCITTWDNTLVALSTTLNYNIIDIDATNTYAEDPPIDKIFFDYVDDQYRYFHKKQYRKGYDRIHLFQKIEISRDTYRLGNNDIR